MTARIYDRDAMSSAATEALWGCRLSYARLVTPVDPPAIAQFDPSGAPNAVWRHDWYAHVLFAARLREASQRLGSISEEHKQANKAFAAHWKRIEPLRDVLMHGLEQGHRSGLALAIPGPHHIPAQRR